MVSLLGGMALGCGDPQVAEFRVLSWNVANCDPHRNGASHDNVIGQHIADQASLRFANVILLQEISERATDRTNFWLGPSWECTWRKAHRDGIATCVEGSLTVVGSGDFRGCYGDGVPNPKPEYGTCLQGDTCGNGRDGFGWLQVQYKTRAITNVHVQLGGVDDVTGLPNQARQQIVDLHNNIAKTGIVGGDFNWVSPHDCSSLEPNGAETTCNSDWHLATDNLGITLWTMPGPDDETDRFKIDHIATIEAPDASPGVFRQVLGYGQSHDTCTNLGCPSPLLPCSNHCMVHASFTIPPGNFQPGPAPTGGISPLPSTPN
jgi:hypothetical protein